MAKYNTSESLSSINIYDIATECNDSDYAEAHNLREAIAFAQLIAKAVECIESGDYGTEGLALSLYDTIIEYQEDKTAQKSNNDFLSDKGFDFIPYELRVRIIKYIQRGCTLYYHKSK